MFNRDIFIPSLSTVILAGMIAFLSCAHQAGQEDDIDNYFGNMVSAENSTENPETNTTASMETGTNELSDANSPQNQELASSTVELKVEAQSSEVIEPSQAPTQTEGNNGTEIPVASSLQSESSLPSEGSLDNAELSQESSLATDSNSLASMESELDKMETNSSEPAPMKIGSNQSGAQIQPQSPSPTPKPVLASPQLTMVPRIPQKALKRKEGALNRFYFVRMGDTPESVSTLIYGSPDKTHQLWVSRGLSWAPGRMVFYSSPKNPTDPTMVSFYKEEGVQGRGFKVKRGDWLSRIAHKYLGSPKSWKEIAVMNQISNPLDLKVGQKLILFPDIQPKFSTPPQVAVTAPPAPEPAPQVAMAANPQPETIAAPSPTAVEAQPRMPLAVKEEKPVKKFSAKAYIRELIEKLARMLGRKHQAP